MTCRSRGPFDSCDKEHLKAMKYQVAALRYQLRAREVTTEYKLHRSNSTISNVLLHDIITVVDEPLMSSMSSKYL